MPVLTIFPTNKVTLCSKSSKVACDFSIVSHFKLAELWWWMKRACENEIRRWEQLSEAVSSCPRSNSSCLNEVLVIGRAGFGYWWDTT